MKLDRRYFEARVAVKREQVAAVESLLQSLGAVAVSLRDLADDPVLEPGVGQTPLWPEVKVCGLFDDDASPQQVRAALSLLPVIGSGQGVEVEDVPERDWVRAWQADFAPMRFGRHLWIVPGHAEPPEPGALLIRLDPGLAFGSGTHPSTRLCLEWIDAHELAGRHVIDFGCGSGVLGIAAALKGAESVIGVDIDPQALLATRENAERNGVGAVVTTLAPADLGTRRSDVVIANILSGTLIELVEVLGNCVSDGGTLVLAGILEPQAAAVAEAYAQGFPGLERSLLEGWACLAGAKRR